VAHGTQVGEIQDLLRRRVAERLVTEGFERSVAKAAAHLVAVGVPADVAVDEAKKAAQA